MFSTRGLNVYFFLILGVGSQANGSPFVPYWDKVGAVGYYDNGVLSMARTLGGPTNQVTTPGRKVLVGWLMGGSQSQSLPRDISLSSSFELLQAFIPELQTLRSKPLAYSSKPSAGSLQMEIVANFARQQGTFGLVLLSDSHGEGGVNLTIECDGNACTAHADASAQKLPAYTAPLRTAGTYSIHAYVDTNIVELIINNRTAFAMYANPPPENAFFSVLGNGDVKAWELASANFA